MSRRWDRRFLSLAREISSWSKDPSTQVGAVVVNDDRRVLATGYNGFPRGIVDKKSRLENKEEKYRYMVHAEMNCIYNAADAGVSLRGATLYIWGLPVCSECAKGVISSGITRIVMPKSNKYPEKWIDSFAHSSAMFDEAEVTYEFRSWDKKGGQNDSSSQRDSTRENT
jgi:dCMP deaminase